MLNCSLDDDKELLGVKVLCRVLLAHTTTFYRTLPVDNICGLTPGVNVSELNEIDFRDHAEMRL